MVLRKDIAIKPAWAGGNFLPRIIAPWAPKRQLPSILLPAGTAFGVPPKDTAAFAWRRFQNTPCRAWRNRGGNLNIFLACPSADPALSCRVKRSKLAKKRFGPSENIFGQQPEKKLTHVYVNDLKKIQI
jgi:hypothetical protein